MTLTVRVKAGAQQVHATEIHLYLPAGMKVVGPDGSLQDTIDAGSTLPLVVVNHVDNAAGLVDFAASFQNTPPTGTFTLATLRLRAQKPVDSDAIRFLQLPGRMTDVLFEEESVLGDLGVTMVTVSGYHIDLPVIMSGL